MVFVKEKDHLISSMSTRASYLISGTKRVIRRVQEDGACWCGGTECQGKAAMRISVSSWQTTKKDIEGSVKVILEIADEENKKSG